MKKIVIGSFLLMSAFSVFAQTEQGNWLVGGNLNLNTSKNYTQIAFTPMAGYFFVENFAAGGNVTLAYSKTGENKSTVFGIGPFARYYFGTTNIRPLLQFDVQFTSDKTKFPTTGGGTSSNTENGSTYFLGGGLAAFINDNVAIEGLAGYSHTKLKDIDGSGGFNFRVGFQVYLSQRQVEKLTK